MKLITIIFLLFGALSVFSQDGIQDKERSLEEVLLQLDKKQTFELDMKYKSIISWNTKDQETLIESTGIEAELKYNKCSTKVAALLNNEISNINSDDFDLNFLINELIFKCEVDSENAALILEVGKIKFGVKTSTSNREVSGLMGINLKIIPKNIPLIQEWLNKNNLKVTKIQVARYTSDKGTGNLDFGYLEKTDMTSLSLYLSKNRNIHTFFLYRKPDAGNPSPTKITAGLIYIFQDAKFTPTLVAIAQNSKSDYVDLDLFVGSVEIKLAHDISLSTAFASVDEKLSGTKTVEYHFEVEKMLYSKKKVNILGSLEYIYETHDNNFQEEIPNNGYFGFQLEIKF